MALGIADAILALTVVLIPRFRQHVGTGSPHALVMVVDSWYVNNDSAPG